MNLQFMVSIQDNEFHHIYIAELNVNIIINTPRR